MYKAETGNLSFEIDVQDSGFLINGKAFSWDIVKISDDHFHILYEGKSFRAEIVSVNWQTKTFEIKINQRTYPVTLKDRFHLLLEQMGMTANAAHKLNSIKAPMPGLIVALKVKDGDVVKENDPLIVLEAMKMENIIKSPGEGVVKAVRVKQGEGVEKGQVLIEF